MSAIGRFRPYRNFVERARRIDPAAIDPAQVARCVELLAPLEGSVDREDRLLMAELLALLRSTWRTLPDELGKQLVFDVLNGFQQGAPDLYPRMRDFLQGGDVR
jgi:hypothetical protein